MVDNVHLFYNAFYGREENSFPCFFYCVDVGRKQGDIHDRVNYAVTGSALRADTAEKILALNLQIDEKICTMYEYFDIFLNRMLMCRGAAEMLGYQFRLTVNGGKVL